MRRIIPAVLVLSVVLFGCKVKELADKAKIAKDLNKQGTMDLLKDVANDHYDPPKDGKLTDAQVKMYLKVRERQSEIAKAAWKNADEHFHKADAAKNSIAGVMQGIQGLKDAGQMATADLRAAKDLGFNTQEYLWVKGQVLAASVTAFAEGMTNVMDAQKEAYLAQTKKAYEEAKDEQTKQMYKQQLDEYERTVKEGKEATSDQDPAVVYNRQLLKKYDAELSALGDVYGKDGETKNTMSDFQKKMEEMSKGAKKEGQ